MSGLYDFLSCPKRFKRMFHSAAKKQKIFMLYYVFLKELCPSVDLLGVYIPKRSSFLLKGWPCRVPVSSLTLDARRCAVGQALFNICFSVAFSV